MLRIVAPFTVEKIMANPGVAAIKNKLTSTSTWNFRTTLPFLPPEYGRLPVGHNTPPVVREKVRREGAARREAG
jgi:hypothetical protein